MTNIHFRPNVPGLPLAVLLTSGEGHDSTAYLALMAGYDVDPEVLLGDQGYESDPIRNDVRGRGGTPEIPTKNNRRVQHSVDRTLYAQRARIEQFFNKLKHRPVACAAMCSASRTPEQDAGHQLLFRLAGDATQIACLRLVGHVRNQAAMLLAHRVRSINRKRHHGVMLFMNSGYLTTTTYFSKDEQERIEFDQVFHTDDSHPS